VPLGDKTIDSTRRPPLPEKLVLFLYWLSCGYGLRAGRALLALGLTVACGALLLSKWGAPGHSPWLFAVESSISLLHPPGAPKDLSRKGEIVTLVLRIAGPLFLGLALLSLRGRIRR
jgi:hypothetical protein